MTKPTSLPPLQAPLPSLFAFLEQAKCVETVPLCGRSHPIPVHPDLPGSGPSLSGEVLAVCMARGELIGEGAGGGLGKGRAAFLINQRANTCSTSIPGKRSDLVGFTLIRHDQTHVHPS